MKLLTLFQFFLALLSVTRGQAHPSTSENVAAMDVSAEGWMRETGDAHRRLVSGNPWSKLLYALHICPGPKICPKPPCKHNGRDPASWHCNSDDGSGGSGGSGNSASGSGGGSDDDDDDHDDDHDDDYDYYYFSSGGGTTTGSGQDMTGDVMSRQDTSGNRRFSAFAYILFATALFSLIAGVAAYRKRLQTVLLPEHPLVAGVSKRLNLLERGEAVPGISGNGSRLPNFIEIEVPAHTSTGTAPSTAATSNYMKM